MKLDSSGLDWLLKWNLYSPEATALIDGDNGTRWTYQDLFLKAQALADVLKRVHNVQPGDRVSVLSLNELEFVALYFATSRLGATLVPINYRLTPAEVSFIVKDCQSKLLIYHSEFSSVAKTVAEREDIKCVLLKDSNESKNISLTSRALEIDPSTFAKNPMDFQSQESDVAMIIYTSGTTGFPKGAMLSHSMIFWNSINTFLRLDVSKNDLAVIFLPLFHTGGWNVLTTPFLHHGATVVLTKKFDADQILKLSETHQATLLFGVPTTMDMMSRSSLFKTVDLSRVRYAIVGGEPMPLELIEQWHQKGVPVRQGYGLTEFGPNVFSLNESDSIRKIGSIGFPNFYIEARIVDDGGHECGPNVIGELWLKGPSQMTGYFGNPKGTADTFSGDWLKTGDLVQKDDEGYFYVVGRKKEMYKSGGENVYPAEVERCIRQLKGIREVAVIGVKDPKWGEVGYAFVAVEKDLELKEADLIAHCAEHLAKFKIPKFVQFLEEIPKGDSGKILKKNLAPLISKMPH